MNYEKVNRKKLIEALVAVGISIYSLKGHSDNTWTLEGRVVDESLEYGYRVIELADVQRAISHWNMVAYKTHVHRFGVGFGLRAAEPLDGLDSFLAALERWACLFTFFDHADLVNHHLLVNPMLCPTKDMGSGLVAVCGIRGTRLYEYEDGKFYFLPDNPNIQYLHPIGPAQSPVVFVEDAARLLSSDKGKGAIRVTFEAGRVLAISDNLDWMLVEENGTLHVTETMHGMVVAAVPEAERSRVRMEYFLRMDYDNRPDVMVEVYPDPHSWSSITVYHRHVFSGVETSLNWYATNGSVEAAGYFHNAYGEALNIACKLKAMEN